MHEQINDIDVMLAPYGARRLSSKELTRHESFCFGWQVETEIENSTSIIIDILFDVDFPHSKPSVFVIKPSLNPRDLPHVESGGKLCVWNDRYITNTQSIDYILELLQDAISMLSDGMKGLLNEDFRNEFLSYWVYHCKSNSKLNSLCDHANKLTRQIVVYKSKSKGYIFADSENELINFLDNQNLLPNENKVKPRTRRLSSIHPSAFIYLEKAWLPSEYPTTAGELISLIEREYIDESESIISMIGIALANQYVATPCILISFNTCNGVCFVGIEFKKGLFHKGGYSEKTIMDGFRKHIRVSDLRNRLTNLQINGALVTRIDQSWIMGRDVNHSWEDIQTNKVAILGCGSVGAATARLLVQSGVQELLLFDDDKMNPENNSRHLLGLAYMGMNKAEALSFSLKRDFPHVIIHVFSNSWQNAIKDAASLKLFESSDIIVSCTADWYSDQMLLTLQSDLVLAPIVFAFVEAHAMAAHVIVSPVDSNAFNSLHFLDTNNVGKMKHPVTEWGHETHVNIPACAGAFQPYGTIPLTHLHAMAAEQVMSLLLTVDECNLLARRKIWFDSRSKLHDLGGDWSSAWKEKYGDPNEGNYEQTMCYVNGEWVREND